MSNRRTIGSWLAYAFARIGIVLLAYLPFCVLYRLSDCLSFLFELSGNRKKVITENLQLSFPNKTDSELKPLIKAVYRNFFDVSIVEMIKGFTMSLNAFQKRYHLENPELLKPYFDNNQSIMLVMGHHANWEWGASLQFYHECIDFYKPLKNPYLDDYLKHNRSRHGINLVSIMDSAKCFFRNRRKRCCFVLNADKQNIKERDFDKVAWLPFLGQESPFLLGPAKSARAFGYPVFFLKISRVRRGYYRLRFEPVCEFPKETTELEITQQWVDRLHAEVSEDPSAWFWFWGATRSRQRRLQD